MSTDNDRHLIKASQKKNITLQGS